MNETGEGSKLLCALACNIVLMDGRIVRESRVVLSIGAVLDKLVSMGIIPLINADVGKIGCERDRCL